LLHKINLNVNNLLCLFFSQYKAQYGCSIIVNNCACYFITGMVIHYLKLQAENDEIYIQ
jgi:hypothetical protein